MIIGQYIPGHSWLHSLDARAKTLFVLLFIPIVFLADNLWTNVFLLAFTLFAVKLSQLSWRFLWNGLRMILFLIIFTLFLQLFFNRDGQLLLSVGPFAIYSEGIRMGMIVSLRFFYLVMLTTLVTLTTTPMELTDSIEAGLRPLKRFKVPAHEIALMLSISLRFLPTLADETDRIMKAQQARGVDLKSGPVKDRLKAVVPLMIPLFVSAFKRAEDLATAMEARGYRGGEGRTRWREMTWHRRDTGLLVAFVVLTLILLGLRGIG
ncbi:energy-coupling factor transporter transmembrane component T family protein [Exiguobacterium alkaliphilum]|uniref:energy-coupling factor transporter transmembrane component T family protein n=1 Tax=Exiguobacterium alkaliphilum TaxID=1428684 RepID=UPI00403AFCC5